MLVVVDGDAWLRREAVDAAAAEPLDLVTCQSARAGLNACCAFEPECVLVASTLPDHDAAWLVSAIRGQLTEVSATPILVVCAQEEAEDDRTRLLRCGADVALRKPITARELVAQVEALIAMTARVRTRRSSLPARDGSAVLAVDLDHVPIVAVLAALEVEHRSGEIWMTDRGVAGHRLLLSLASGGLVGGWLDMQPLSPLEALRAALAWEGRRCEFAQGPDQDRPPGLATTGALLRDALRAPDPATWRNVQAEPPPPSSAPKLPRPPPLPRSHPPPAPPKATMPSPALANAPGHKLIESVRPSVRPDPRAEIDQPDPPRRVPGSS